MATRPYWKGYLKLSLVSCAVALYPTATKSERVSFHWLNRETNNRLRQQMVDGETSNPVPREERVRGYEIGKGDYLTIEEDELDAVEIESSHSIDIDSFVPLDEIDPVFLDNSHYLAPDDKVAEEAFAVIREAMVAEGVVGIGRAVLARRERLLVLEPRGKGILATVLHYNYEVRDDHVYFDQIPDVKINNEMLDLAKHIIRTKSGPFDISGFEDRYENALIEMVRAKQAGRPINLPEVQKPRNVINLMEALRSSVATDKGGFEKSDLGSDWSKASKKPSSPARGGKRSEPASEIAEKRPRTAAALRTDARRSEHTTEAPVKSALSRRKTIRT